MNPFGFKLCKPFKYKFKVPKNCGLRFPEYLEIDNDCSAEFIDIAIDVIDYRKIPPYLKISLETLDGLERRYYNIFFIRDK